MSRESVCYRGAGRMLRRWLTTIAVTVVVMFLLAAQSLAGETKDRVIVGVYENPPLTFTDTDGQIKGLFADLLNHWSALEELRVEYRRGSFSELTSALVKGEIDILPVVAATPGRERLMDFPKNSVIPNWGRVYVRPGSDLKTFRDLDGARVAVLGGDLHYDSIRALLRQQGIQPEYVEYGTYEGVLAAVAHKNAEAGVANRLVGHVLANKFDLAKPLRHLGEPFSRADVTFAVSKKAPPGLLGKLDTYLKHVRDDSRSVYYASMDHWVGPLAPVRPPKGIPAAILWLIGLLVCAVLAAVGFNLFLRREVAKRARALQESEQKYHHLFDGLNEAAFLAEVGTGYIIETNAEAEALLGIPRTDIVGLLQSEIHPATQARLQKQKFKEALKSQKPISYDSAVLRKDGKLVPVSLTAQTVDVHGRQCVMTLCRDLTALQQAERALRESEERYRSIFETAGSLIVLMDIDGTVLDCNSCVYDFTGYTRDEIVGTHMFKFVHPDFRRQAEESLHEVMLQGSTRNHEYKLVRKDGSALYSRINSAALRNVEGEFTRVVLIISDITQMKRAQQELRVSEEKYRTLVERAHDGIAIVQDGIIKYANPRMTEMFGWSPQETVGTAFEDYFQSEPKELAAIRDYYQKRMEGEDAPETYELAATSKDGRRVNAEISANRITYQGKPADLVFVRDVTERKRAEEAVRQERDRAQQYLDIAQVILVVLNKEGLVALINHEGCRMLGYSERELIGRNWFEISLPERSREEVRDHFEAVLHGQMPKAGGLEHENPVLTKSGEERIIEWRNVLVRNENGDVVGSLSSGQDVTDRRKAERALREREAQLRQAAKMDSIGRLAGGVAHDFNNLLTGIIGYTEFTLEALPEGEQCHRDLSEVYKLAERASNLTRQLLAFGRRQRLEPTVLNVNTLVEDMSRMLRRLIGEDVELKLDIDPKVGNVRADQGQIEEVLLNLAVNARDAMPDGGVLTIQTANVALDRDYVRTHLDAKEGPHVMLAITDTGLGMDKETLEHVFEPFFTTKTEAGMGLGLASVYGVVHQHGGSVIADSEPAKGTTFRVYLPRVDAPLSAAPQHEKVEVPHGTETVLLVEDEQSVREMAQSSLERNGYKVLPAATADEARRLMAEHSAEVNLVLMDVVMPNANGYELFAKLAAERPSLKVLYMSGYAEKHADSHDPSGRRTPFLAKPFTPGRLAVEVRKVLDAKA